MQPMVNIALRAARSAGEMIVKSADNLDLVKVDEKGRHDFVTEVDRRSEETIIYHISKAYPDHRFLCEESGVSGNPHSDVEWIIDPLDGTTNFIRGIPHVAISIACRIKGKLEHAVIVEPFKHEEFTAVFVYPVAPVKPARSTPPAFLLARPRLIIWTAT